MENNRIAQQVQNDGASNQPIVLKVIRRVTVVGGQTQVQVMIVDKVTGRPLGGVGINGEISLPMWTPNGIQHVRYYILGLAVFGEETIESDIILPEGK